MTENRILKSVFIVIIAFTSALNLAGQDKTIDQIIAIVGGNIILKSEIEQENINLQAQGKISEGDMKCEILENMLIDRLLIAEAQLDTTIIITDSQVNQQLDGQLQMYVSYLGSEKAVEDYFKKPIAVIKAEMEDVVRNQLYSQQMKSKILKDVNITPSEVRLGYRNLKEDEIPVIPEQYEYARITFQPKISLEEQNRVKNRLRELKDRIEKGTSFSAMAVMYSEDPGAKSGGEIGYLGRGQLDPAYAAAAFNLKGDKISNVVESMFGYHIIQVIDKKGEKVNTRHILMRPKISVEAKEDAFKKLDSLANIIRKNDITFENAAMMFSYDKNTRNNGGVAINRENSSSKFTLEELDPSVSKIITKMNINEISAPFETIDEENQQTVISIVKLLKKSESHKANLQSDYQYLAELFLSKKKETVMKEWIASKQADTYIRISPNYSNCNFDFKNWIK
jgi:peptidyl-prolyl cis-trans isomerase SurA